MVRGSLACSLVLFLAGCPSQAPAPPDASVPVDMSPLPPGTLAPASTLTSCLAVDASNVYWTDSGSGNRVLKVSISGGTPQVVAMGGDAPGCVAIDAENAYYTDGAATMVMKAPLAGSGGTGIALATNQHVLPERHPFLVATSGYVYWITDVYGNVDAYDGKNAIVRVKTDGSGTVEVIASEVKGNPAGLATDGNSIYFSDGAGVWAQPIAGGAPIQIPTTSAIQSNTFATDGTNLVVTEVAGLGQGDVALFRVDGTGRKVLSMSLASSLAIDGSGVYAKQDNQLVQLALDGSGAKALALIAPRAIALSPTAIYFTDGASILKLAK